MNESVPQTRLLKSRDRRVVPLCYENEVSKIARKDGMLLTVVSSLSLENLQFKSRESNCR